MLDIQLLRSQPAEVAERLASRGAGFDVVWPQFAANLAIGIVFFAIALARFRKTISQMA